MKSKKLILAITLVAASVGLAALAQSYPPLNDDETLALAAINEMFTASKGTGNEYKIDGQSVQNQVYYDTAPHNQSWTLDKANTVCGKLLMKNRLFILPNGH